ncbi:Superoxide dismutase [Cu-Zn] [Amphibalanus amphitrite]|uniref:Superoxide dismutase [Cu-Zn] n=1 Tax=Amphibalanus amphitrite TaxID=1232801 RepID=A0A6A4WLC6_AMPAM|nr:Superoxide dismutase [Cu-Zn] [Amphibalanus amphitrite]
MYRKLLCVLFAASAARALSLPLARREVSPTDQRADPSLLLYSSAVPSAVGLAGLPIVQSPIVQSPLIWRRKRDAGAAETDQQADPALLMYDVNYTRLVRQLTSVTARDNSSGPAPLPTPWRVTPCRHGWRHEPERGVTLMAKFELVCENSQLTSALVAGVGAGAAVGQLVVFSCRNRLLSSLTYHQAAAESLSRWPGARRPLLLLAAAQLLACPLAWAAARVAGRRSCLLVSLGLSAAVCGLAASLQRREAVIQAGTDEGVSGLVMFYQTAETEPVQISGSISGLAPGLHGLHVHQNGNLTSACSDAGSHFNPAGSDHGAHPNLADRRHVADLGNVVADETGTADFQLQDKLQTLYDGENVIVGRAIVIHALEDDLGLGGDEESKKTGNAGARVGCGLIELSQGLEE